MRYRAVNLENFHALLGPLRSLSWIMEEFCVDLFIHPYSTHRELYFDTHECCLQLSVRVKHVGPLEFSI